MKKLPMAIGGQRATRDDVRAKVSRAKSDWLAAQRGREAARSSRRRHIEIGEADREAKAQATAMAKRRRAEERERREMEKMLARVGYLSRRSQAERDRMLRVEISVPSSQCARLEAVCPRRLYNRQAPLLKKQSSGMSRAGRKSADGFCNIVFKQSPRGFGRSKSGRSYEAGDLGRLARYILRPEGAEDGVLSFFTNVTSVRDQDRCQRTISVEECAEVVDFCAALETFEHTVNDQGNVGSHFMLAMPSALSPSARSLAMLDIGQLFDDHGLPCILSLQKPDPNGNQNNYHLHGVTSTRPFAVEGDRAWSFEAGKATELNSPAGMKWLRRKIEAIFNYHLDRDGSPIRYSGVSQAERGVPAANETPMGQAKTAVVRKAEDASMRLIASFRAFLLKKVRALKDLRNAAQESLGKAQNEYQIAIRRQYPDPTNLDGLCASDFERASATDLADDEWYFPAYCLLRQLTNEPEARQRFISIIDDEPTLDKAELPAAYHALADAARLPDILEHFLIHEGDARRAEKAEKVQAARRQKEAEALEASRREVSRSPSHRNRGIVEQARLLFEAIPGELSESDAPQSREKKNLPPQAPPHEAPASSRFVTAKTVGRLAPAEELRFKSVHSAPELPGNVAACPARTKANEIEKSVSHPKGETVAAGASETGSINTARPTQQAGGIAEQARKLEPSDGSEGASENGKSGDSKMPPHPSTLSRGPSNINLPSAVLARKDDMSR